MKMKVICPVLISLMNVVCIFKKALINNEIFQEHLKFKVMKHNQKQLHHFVSTFAGNF